MDLKELQRHWQRFGKQDPLWAILTDSQKRGGRWNHDEFFETGRRDIDKLMHYVESLGLEFKRRKALDFGCGVGRLTQGLCHYFDECWGVDIAPSMIKLATRYNRHAGRCHYAVNAVDDLSAFPDNTFDLICTVIVLQHMRPEYSKRYIEEFMRVLSPGGVLIFQIPSEPVQPTQAQDLRKPLPDSALRAQLTLPDSLGPVLAGSVHEVRVRVRNLGDAAWPAWSSPEGSYPVEVGNHWRDSEGSVVVFDDGRANLPKHLQPSEETEVVLPVKAPATPGSYILELDAVQELVSWFADRGSVTATMPVQVRGRPRWKRGLARAFARMFPERNFTPRHEMYAVPKDEVLALIDANGGKVADIQQDFWAGPAWIGFRYCVIKAGR